MIPPTSERRILYLRDDCASPPSNDGSLCGYSHSTQKKDRSPNHSCKIIIPLLRMSLPWGALSGPQTLPLHPIEPWLQPQRLPLLGPLSRPCGKSSGALLARVIAGQRAFINGRDSEYKCGDTRDTVRQGTRCGVYVNASGKTEGFLEGLDVRRRGAHAYQSYQNV